MATLEHIKNNLTLALEKMQKTTVENQKYNYYIYDLDLIKQCDIFITVGTRTNGKTTATQRDLCLLDFLVNDFKFIKLCRTKEEMKAKYQEGWITETNIKILNFYDLDIQYKNDKYFINILSENMEDDVLNINKFVNTGFEIGRVIPLLKQKDYKSNNFESYNKIIFDECFLAKDSEYRPTELDCLNSFIATVNRTRENLQVFLIGNIFPNRNPYFEYFGINESELKAGNTYAYTNNDFEDGARILLEYTKPVFKNPEDTPRILRTKGNAKNILSTEYEPPENVINQNDWLIIALKENQFNNYYSVFCKLEISVDNTLTLKENIKVNNYYVILDNLHTDLIYIISEKVKRKGLEFYYDTKNVYKIDYDIRHKLPLFDLDFFRNKKIKYGDYNTLIEFREVLKNE